MSTFRSSAANRKFPSQMTIYDGCTVKLFLEKSQSISINLFLETSFCTVFAVFHAFSFIPCYFWLMILKMIAELHMMAIFSINSIKRISFSEFSIISYMIYKNHFWTIFALFKNFSSFLVGIIFFSSFPLSFSLFFLFVLFVLIHSQWSLLFCLGILWWFQFL